MKNNEYKALFCLVTLFLIRQLSTISFDLIIGDEASVVMAYKTVFQGGILYKDVWSQYAPLPPYFFLPIFKLFGFSLLVIRYTSIVLLVLGLIASFYICRRFMTVWWSSLTALMSFFMIFQPIYSYSNVFSLVGILYAVLYLIKFEESRDSYLIFLSGLFVSVALLQKPVPIGVATWVTLGIFVVPFRSFRVILFYLLGSLILTIPIYLLVILSNSTESLADSFLYYLNFHDGSNYVFSLFKPTIKDIYYSFFICLPVIVSIAGFTRYRKHWDIGSLYILALLSPILFIQYYWAGDRIGHGEMGLIIPPTIFLSMYFVSKIPYRKLVYPVLALIYIFPSLYLLKPEIRDTTLTVPNLKGIKVSEQMAGVIEKTYKFVLDNVPADQSIVTVGSDADIFNIILDNSNPMGSKNIYWEIMLSDSDKADDAFRDNVLDILESTEPLAIIVGREGIPGTMSKMYIDNYYKLKFTTGKFQGSNEPYRDYHFNEGMKVYIRSLYER